MGSNSRRQRGVGALKKRDQVTLGESEQRLVRICRGRKREKQKVESSTLDCYDPFVRIMRSIMVKNMNMNILSNGNSKFELGKQKQKVVILGKYENSYY